MLEILLVFSIAGEPEQISDRVFESLEECVTFVNHFNYDQNVFNSDYYFQFYANDGVKFEGQCIDKEDYEKKSCKGIDCQA